MKEPASYTEPHRINTSVFQRSAFSSLRHHNIRD